MKIAQRGRHLLWRRAQACADAGPIRPGAVERQVQCRPAVDHHSEEMHSQHLRFLGRAFTMSPIPYWAP